MSLTANSDAPPEQKPLPSLPPPSTPLLSIDSREHLHSFICKTLHEEGLLQDQNSKASEADEYDDDESGRSWVLELERALDEFGESIHSGRWLAGIRRARLRLKEAMDVADTAAKQTPRPEEIKAFGEVVQPDGIAGLRVSRASNTSSLSTETSSSGASETAQRQLRILRRLGELISTPSELDTELNTHHLLLTISPFTGGLVRTRHDVGLDHMPSRASCSFSANKFPITHEGRVGGTVLYGLDNWPDPLHDSSEEAIAARIVGGTFNLNGVPTKAHYDALCRTLRLSLFLLMSLILEQQLYLDSHISLRYPEPAPIPSPTVTVTSLAPTSPPPASPAPPTPQTTSTNKKGASSGIWSFLAKKKEELLRVADSLPLSVPTPRRGSLNIRPSAVSSPPEPVLERPPLLHEAPDTRRRTFSFLGFPPLRSPTFSAPSPPTFEPRNEELFASTLERLNSTIPFISTTPHAALSAPSMLTRLCAIESSDPKRRIAGDELTALHSLLGWTGNNRVTRAKEISGLIPAFVRHQGFVALYSEHVPIPVEPLSLLKDDEEGDDLDVKPSTPKPSDAGTALGSVISNPASGLSATSEPSGPSPPASALKGTLKTSTTAPQDTMLTQCTDRRRIIGYRYYQDADVKDVRLGEVVAEWCRDALEPCVKPGCTFVRGEHELRWIHSATRITLQKHFLEEEGAGVYATGKEMMVWIRCKICGQETERKAAGDATHLISFAKYLEMLVYSPQLWILSTELCNHTSSSSFSTTTIGASELPISRFNMVRFFGYGRRWVSFSLSRVDDVFELRVPRLQVVRSGMIEHSGRSVDDRTLAEDDEAKKMLRREIRAWWQGVAEHLDRLEEEFEAAELANRKSLPRLPSEDETFDDEEEEAQLTPRARIAGLPELESFDDGMTRPVSSAHPVTELASSPSTPRAAEVDKRLPNDKTLPRDKALPMNTAALLSRLRHTLQKTEQDLYEELSRTPASTLNDVRRSFRTSAKGATRRLQAWQTKHMKQRKGDDDPLPSLSAPEPTWWNGQCHIVPGGGVIVHEDDWGSIIAFTLSCTDYVKEMSNFAVARLPTTRPPSAATSLGPSPLPSPAGPAPTSKLSYFTAPFRSNPRPDPDEDGVQWHEPETCSAVISRKEHPRDPAYLLSLRDVLLNKKSTETSNGSITSQLLGRNRQTSNPPMSAWAKPEVEVSLQAAGGLVIEPEGDVKVDKLLHELEEATTESTSSSILSDSLASASEFIETHLRRGMLASLTSDPDRIGHAQPAENNTSESTISDHPLSTWKSKGDQPLEETAKPDFGSSSDPGRADAHAASITSSFGHAMRLMLRAGDTFRPSSSATSAKNHHALLSTDPLAIDERPHVKYDFTVGKMRFSCTVYYAKQFEILRRKCGVEDVFVQSMKKSANWAADGGKSKSNFWKTWDERYIIKTLVNAWNVADLQVLLELGPSYFRYMNQTANKATVLAKLFGFYTVEVRNLDSGATQHKADLVVMENLFFDRKIVKTFDLKGIQGRKVKAKGGASAPKTLFDEEWMEGQQRALLLVHPHSKAVLDESIRNDCQFLADSNIMDYSLLLGIDGSTKQIACGLVDAIGSYTFAKTLEYKAKQGLNSGKQVTVVPPQEYQHRFVKAMNDYFVPCPDKWSTSGDGVQTSGDPWSLPSVF